MANLCPLTMESNRGNTLLKELVPETSTDTRDHNGAVWLDGCIWKRLEPETCTEYSCDPFRATFWYKLLEHVSPL